MSRQVPLPSRPAIPVAFFAMVAAVASIRACLWWRWRITDAWPAAVLTLMGACALAAPRLWGRAARTGPAAVLLVLSLGFASGSLCSGRVGACADDLASSAVSGWEFEIENDMTLSGGSWRGRAIAAREGSVGGSVWLVAPEELCRGSVIAGVGRFKPDGDDRWGRASYSQGVCGTVTLARVASAHEASGVAGAVLAFRRSLVESLCPSGAETPAGAVLAGLVCGSTVGIKALGLDDAFAACGASHLIAVSGSHLSVVSALLAGLLGRVRGRRGGKLALHVLATGLFVVLCGGSPSAVRSWVMAVAAAGAGLAGRRGHALSSVSVTALSMALAQPEICGQLGYLLSVSCVCGIGLFGGYAKHVATVVLGAPVTPRWAPGRLGRAIAFCRRYVVESVALGAVCQLVSLPVAVPAFGKLSVIGLAAQVPLSALFAPALASGLVFIALRGVPLLGDAARSCAFLAASSLARLVGFFSSAPICSVAVEAGEGELWAALVALAALLLLAWPRVTRAGCAAAAACAAAVCAAYLARWRWFSPPRICVMDVGQADAVLLADGGSTLLVDAGVDGGVASALARNHVYHLDAILLTHLDEDHVGGLDDLVGVADVGAVYVAQGVAEAMDDRLRACVERLSGGAPREVSYGDVLRVGGYDARVVWPREAVDGDGNEDSVMLSVTYGRDGRSLSALLTGDAEKDELARVIEAGDVGDVDFLKVGHHGSAASIEPGEAALLSAEVAAASAGEGNRYGHPRQECVDALESSGSLFLCTKDVGDVTVSPGKAGPSVSCSKGTVSIE
ncbi:MAG: ComEC/Rec2 family competence protein [Coriobacteriia bacterium]|nr:ComEC/Rec2 family competence protein [Coriobacteriia bacterium]